MPLVHFSEDRIFKAENAETAVQCSFQNLEAEKCRFFSAVQVLAGDLNEARRTYRQFFAVWEAFGVFPERYYYDGKAVHHTENYYPLRPELAESTFLLFQVGF
jgi:hypothetical protein